MTNEYCKTMRAMVWEGKPFHMSLKDVPRPHLQAKEDAIVRLTTAAICGTDLHTYHGIFGSSKPGWIMGHEGIGIVIEIGSAVSTLKVGDRVIIPDAPDDGHFNVLPPTFADFQGFGLGGDFGGLGGTQAEYLRIPFADQTLIPVPKSGPGDAEYLFISDIWSTAWTCLDFSGFQPGDSVAVFGAGPVGLLCAYSALLRGASKVYSIDHVPKRLEKAASIGAIPINFTKGSPSKQILELEPFGVTRSCDCCGYECVNEQLKPQENYIITEAIEVTSQNGGIGVIGIYMSIPKSDGAPRADTVSPSISFPISDFWTKNLSIKAGAVDPKIIAPRLVELVNSGKAKPGFIISDRVRIEEAPESYKRFDKHLETKVIIRFPWYEDEGLHKRAATEESHVPRRRRRHRYE